MHSKSITQPVWTDIVDSTGFRIYQRWQTCFFGTFFDDLPSPVPINAKNQPLPIPKNRTTTADVIFKDAQSVTINGQHPLATVFLLLGLSLLNLTSALWAKGMTSAESLPAPGAGQLQASFEM